MLKEDLNYTISDNLHAPERPPTRCFICDVESHSDQSLTRHPIYDVESPNGQAGSSSKVRQRFRNRCSRLALNDAEIHSFVILKPRRRLVARIIRNVGIRKLLNPGFFIRDRAAVRSAGFADAEVLVVPFRKRIVEVTVGVVKGGVGAGIDIYTDNVDVVWAREPALKSLNRVIVWGPEHEDLGVACDCSMHPLPRCYKVRLRYRAGQRPF